MQDIINRIDQRIISIIALWPESWRPTFIIITSLGDPVVTVWIGAMVAVYACTLGNIRLVLSGMLVWVTLVIGSILKVIFSRARPLTEYAANLRVDTFSFPSGHSSGAMIAYGLLALLAWHYLPQPWAMIAASVCFLIIIAVGISRIYLGAHFPSDVIAGWLLGALMLYVIVFIIKPIS